MDGRKRKFKKVWDEEKHEFIVFVLVAIFMFGVLVFSGGTP